MIGNAWAKPPVLSEPMECSVLKLGQEKYYKTNVTVSKDGKIHAYATIELKRDRNDVKAEKCMATYEFWVQLDKHDYQRIKVFHFETPWDVGVTMIGFSPDSTKISADFWWAGGDYMGHRPVVFDLNTKQLLFRELESQISKQLPSCDYFEEYVGVTNTGMAIIHIPKSDVVEKGCPDQGNWLFNLKSGKVQRIKKSPSKSKQSPR